MEEKIKRIDVVVVEPGEMPYAMEIEDELSELQYLVDGRIEMITPFNDDVAIICNEEGKLDGLPLNRCIKDENGSVMDIIAGTFFICRIPDDSDEFESLTCEQKKKYLARFRYPELFFRDKDGAILVKRTSLSSNKNQRSMER